MLYLITCRGFPIIHTSAHLMWESKPAGILSASFISLHSKKNYIEVKKIRPSVLPVDKCPSSLLFDRQNIDMGGTK